MMQTGNFLGTWITFWRKRTILCLFPLFMEARLWSLWYVSSTVKMEVEHSCEMPVNFCQNIRRHPNPWRLCSWNLLKVLVNLEITKLPQCLGTHIKLQVPSVCKLCYHYSTIQNKQYICKDGFHTLERPQYWSFLVKFPIFKFIAQIAWNLKNPRSRLLWCHSINIIFFHNSYWCSTLIFFSSPWD